MPGQALREAERYGGKPVTKTITGTAALAMILTSPICYTFRAVPLSIGLAVAGWAVLTVLAYKMEEK